MRGSDQERYAGRWSAWFGFAGLFAAFGITIVVASVLRSLDRAGDGRLDGGPLTTVMATLVQDGLLVLVAIVIASPRGLPSLADFGWRRAPWRRVAVTLAAGTVAFYAFALGYGLLVDPAGEQNVLDALGADRGGAYLLISAAIVIILAPISEETFFRGFFYRSLRNRFGVAAAVGIIAVVFGSIHFSGPDTLLLLPVLAVLGAVFCLMYEFSGSLLPAVGLHTINNGIAFAATAPSGDAGVIAAGMALATVAVSAAILRRGRNSD